MGRSVHQTRRPALLLLTAVATTVFATVFASSGLAQSTTNSAAGLPGPGRSPIKHVVVFLQENQTFDSVLGTWCAQNPGRCPGPHSGVGSTVTMADGVGYPIRQGPDIVPQVDHEIWSQQTAWDGGKNDGWTKISGCTVSASFNCLIAYTPAQLPATAQLATAYAISDETFTFALHPSWADHFEWFTSGQSLGFDGRNPSKDPNPNVTQGPGWGCDSNMQAPWAPPGSSTYVMEPTCFPDPRTGLPNGGAYRPTPVPPVKTLAEDCNLTAGCTWAVYNTQKLWSIVDTFAYLRYKDDNVKPTDQFLTDAKGGTLPSLTFLTPSFSGYSGSTSQHNGNSMADGDRAIRAAITAAMTGPEASSTAIFLTYDDCGCFYDTQGPGRMPMVIISPWVKPGFTDSTTTSFAGVAHFAEITLGMPALNGNDRSAYPYTNAFDFSASRSLVRLPALKRATIPRSSQTYLRLHPQSGAEDAADPS